MKSTKEILLITLAFILAGCSSPKTIYHWDDYQDVVYDYYQLDTAGVPQQIEDLKLIIERASSKNMPVPPGLHAHLGMLYIHTGNIDMAMMEFESEKNQFPESAVFMDYLMSKSKGNQK